MNGRRAAWPIVAAVLVCCYVLWPLACNPGVWNHDELDLLFRLRSGHSLQSWDVFRDTSPIFYRPLGYSALALQLEAGGATAPCFHWISIAQHLLNAWLAALLFRRLHCGRGAAFLVVLLPSAIGAIAWVAAAYDRLAVTFVLLSCLALASGRARATWLAVPAYALALLSKETAVVFGLVAWLPLFRWTPSARRCSLALAVLAAAFVVGRLSTATPDLGTYAPDFGFSAGVRLLRYACFPFALGAAEPMHVRGYAWVPGLFGAALVLALSWRRDRRGTMGAGVAIVVSLLPVVCVRDVQTQYTYASTLAWAWLIALALGRRDTDGRAGAWRTVGFCVLVGLLGWHARQSAEYFEEAGRTMSNFEAAYAELPPGEVAVAAETAIGRSVALRFAVHVRQCRRSPTLRVLDAPGEAGSLLLAADGSVRRQ